MMQEEVDKQDIESPPATEPEETAAQVTQNETQLLDDDRDMLDSVFNETEKVCCGLGTKQVSKIEESWVKAPEAPLVEDFDAKDVTFLGEEIDLMTESPDKDFALQSVHDGDEEMLGEDMTQASQLRRDLSLTKEAVEVQAHFDDEEDGVTIISENATEVESRLGRWFVGDSDDDGDSKSTLTTETKRKRRKICLIFLVWLVIVVALIGLIVGVSNKNERENETSLSKAIGVDGSGSEVDGDSSESDQATAPVPSPAEASVISPSPTTSPTTCIDTISVDSTCYGYFREPITVDFKICDPNSGDWVALYPEGADPSDLGFPRFEWNYSCGDKECATALAGNAIEMTMFTPPGRYQAYLITNENGDVSPPFVGLASSEVFEVTTGPCE